MIRGLSLRLLIGLIVLVGLAVVVLLGRYGGGEPYPDLSGEPVLDESVLEVVVTSPEPIGNLAVSADGRVFYTIHPESRPEGAKLLEWIDGEPQPYPSAEAQELFQTPLGVVIDRQSRLWTIDHGNHGTSTPRLLAFDLATGGVVHDHALDSSIAQLGSFLQDLQVDSTGRYVFIADVSFWRKNPGLVVYDVEARSGRRVLESDESVSPQDWLIRNPTKDMKFFGGLVVLKPGVDGIAIDRNDEWLYYGAMAHDTMFRIEVADLLDASLSEGALAARVEPVGPKPLNDGMSTDNEGNLLITDVEHGAVFRMSPDGELTNLVESPRIRWADALSYGPDGWLYVADSAIPDQMLRSKSHIREAAPYHIFRFKPGIDGVPGQ
jgi:sugar lactone lactonase YvrE